MTQEDVRTLLHHACIKAGSQTAWATAHGLSPGYVCDVINGRRPPSARVLEALGMRCVVDYRYQDVRE